MKKLAGVLTVLAALGMTAAGVCAATHLNVPAGSLVTLEWDVNSRTWHRIMASGAPRDFSVPAGRALVITDVSCWVEATPANDHVRVELKVRKPGLPSKFLWYGMFTTNAYGVGQYEAHLSGGLAVTATAVLSADCNANGYLISLVGYLTAFP